MLAECAIVAVTGGASAAICIPAIANRIPEFTMAAPVWLFAVAITAGAVLLVSVPAGWNLLRAPLASGGRVTRSRIGGPLIAAEVAMALVLTGAALLTRSFAAILDENLGFRTEHV
jgi:hypothetical protein